MKITVDVDCTPEEARRFLGLPDLTPVHQAYVEQMARSVSEGLGPDHFAEMMKSWAPMGEGALNMWKSMFEQMGSGRK